MKITRLSLAGFGPYKNEQRVDFESFDDDGIFLITGRTGAGKSSILDAICYALYNSVPRYDGSQQKLRSDHCGPDDPTWVELEFTIGDDAYRVRRTPEYDRPKQRGTGTTPTPATAQLSRRVGDGWEGMSARLVDVNRDLVDLVGLSKDQFLQVILLAQNRFQQFLKADNNERQGVLRSLFGTSRFRQVEEALLERRKALETQLAGSRATIAQYARQAAGTLQLEAPASADIDWIEAGLLGLGVELELATIAATTADEAFTAADTRNRAQHGVRAEQERRDRAAATLATMLERSEAIDGERVAVSDALRASSVWPHITASRAADDALARARKTEVAARDAFGVTESPTKPHLDAVIDDLTRQLGALAGVLEDEKRLPALEKAVRRSEKRRDAAIEAIDAATGLIAGLPELIDSARTDAAAASVTAAGATAAQESVDRLSRAERAARDALALEGKRDTAAAKDLAAFEAYREADANLRALMEARLTGYAAELALELVPGEPCSVCGSLDHPAPTTAEAEPVSQDDIDAARIVLDDRSTRMATAKRASDAIAIELAEAVARADGKSLDVLEEELSVACVALGECESAAKRAAKLDREVTTLTSQLTDARTQLDALAAERDEAAVALAEAVTLRDATTARITAECGEFETVSLRVESLTAMLATAKRLDDAIDTVNARQSELSSAVAAVDTQLAEQRFDSEAAVEKARLADDAIAASEARIREHDQAIATARATLAEPAIAALPADLVEVDDAELVAARSARDAALATRTSLAGRVAEVERVVASVRAELASSAALHAQFADVNELASVVHGDEPNTMRMKLETYVLAAQLEEIVAAANARLTVMTSGRFTLEHDDSRQFRGAQSGLGLAILDQHTGRSRATHSLSGGETFLASLALALGLAEVVTSQAGGITLDTLFIDEGFGSLDDETLEVAMTTLDSLRAGGRTIGLISHVPAMKDQILAKLRVAVDASGYSSIEQEVG